MSLPQPTKIRPAILLLQRRSAALLFQSTVERAGIDSSSGEDVALNVLTMDAKNRNADDECKGKNVV